MCSVQIKKRDRFRRRIMNAPSAMLILAKSVSGTSIKLMGRLTCSVVTALKGVKQGARETRENVLDDVLPFVETSLAVFNRVISPPEVYAASTRGARQSAARAIFASMTPTQRANYSFKMAEYRLQIQCNALGYRATVDLVGTSPDLPLASRSTLQTSPIFKSQNFYARQGPLKKGL